MANEHWSVQRSWIGEPQSDRPSSAAGLTAICAAGDRLQRTVAQGALWIGVIHPAIGQEWIENSIGSTIDALGKQRRPSAQ
jgi:hypothetical protein